MISRAIVQSSFLSIFYFQETLFTSYEWMMSLGNMLLHCSTEHIPVLEAYEDEKAQFTGVNEHPQIGHKHFESSYNAASAAHTK
jgi:hypothetical protein